MTEPIEPDDRPDESDKPDLFERRGFSWAMLVVVMVLTLIAALVLAYLITVHNFPAH